jgi:thioredoxin-like negative regulator of GroEL
MVEPVLKELASSHPGLLMVARVDIDDETELARRFNVTATPTFILQRKGTQLARMDGAPKENTDLIAWANQFLK